MAGRETWHQQAALRRKLHIGFDAVTGRIVASILTDRDVDDASQVGPLLDQIAEPVEVFLAACRTGIFGRALECSSAAGRY